jgi:carboxymethylenebutenolidase
MAGTAAAAPTTVVRADSTLPASAAEAEARLARSPRHAEWVNVANGADTTRVWVVYPERREKAPVVIVVHEIFGLSPWIRAVADQLAADGFIAVAPDLLTRYDVPGSPTNPNADSARAAIRNVSTEDMNRQVAAVARWAMALPAALPKYGIVGFCWGGSASFNHAVLSPTGLAASVVYYGSSPAAAQLGSVKVPVLGLYGGNDARVNATIPPADSAMRALGKTLEHHVYDGAGHGFLRLQDGQAGANLAATQKAWPATIAWFRRHLGS